VALILSRLFGGESGESLADADCSGEGVAEVPAASPPAANEVRRPIDRELQRRIEKLLRETLAKAGRLSKGKVTAANSRLAVHVCTTSGRGELVSIEADRALRPASNSKLVTTAAALVLLGADWSYETRFESSARVEGGHLAGDLVVRAGADPLYDPDARGRVSHLLQPAIEELRAAGIERVDGRLVLDEGTFLVPGPGPGWPSASQHWQEHCALAGGFTANGGCLTAVVKPGKVGGKASSALRPEGQNLRRVGSVKTVRAGARLDIAVGARAASATLRGEIPSSVEVWDDRFAHPDPVELFGSVLRHHLSANGVSITGPTVRERNRPTGTPLATLRTPLAFTLSPINEESNNSVADQLFLALGAATGHGGTREGGARALKGALEHLGVSREGFVQVDGSGLSRDNRLTARQLTALLRAVENLDRRSADVFFDSLPVSGRSGSLARRMKGTPAAGRVHAKTGWIQGASALSGYVDTSSGARLCFSFLVEYPRVSGLNTHCWKPLGDEICNELVKWHE